MSCHPFNQITVEYDKVIKREIDEQNIYECNYISDAQKHYILKKIIRCLRDVHKLAGVKTDKKITSTRIRERLPSGWKKCVTSSRLQMKERPRLTGGFAEKISFVVKNANVALYNICSKSFA